MGAYWTGGHTCALPILALTMVRERLSPAERTSLLLHDVFGFPFPVVARIVGRSPEACRKLASRARRSVRSASPAAAADVGVPAPSIDPRQVLAERFIAACRSEEHTSALQSLMRISYAVFCLKK